MFVLFQVTVLVNFNKPAVYLRHKVILKNIGNQTVFLVTIDVQCQKTIQCLDCPKILLLFCHEM